MAGKTIRIAGGSGMSMDSAISVPQLLQSGGHIDYIVFDYLGEGAMDYLAKLHMADPNSGFQQDFLTVHVGPFLHEFKKRGIKILANAGAMNPSGLAKALEKLAAEKGVDMNIAYVEGDNLKTRQQELNKEGYKEMFSGKPLPENCNGINAYLGAIPTAIALDRGADIVVTGRAVDSASTLGALIHEFGWKYDDWDLLAAGSAIGHLIECGCQVTGGTFTDWRDVPDWANIGFPIAECEADGTCVITKPDNTGGLVTPATVGEQLLYEISDPQAYIVPDVVCDFSGAKLKSVGKNRVHVSGIKGYPATSTYKVCATYNIGWRTVALLSVLGLEAVQKAQAMGEALIERCNILLRASNMGEWNQTSIEVLGSESNFGAHARRPDTREVILRIVADHDDPRAAGLMAREQLGVCTSMAPGTFSQPPVVSQLSQVFLFLMPKDKFEITIGLKGKTETVQVPTKGGFDKSMIKRPPVPAPVTLDAKAQSVRLVDLAWARCGDKGNLFNLGIMARKPEYLAYIRTAMTQDAVGDWYAHCFPKGAERRVDRYELPGFDALNFVVHESLDGGSSSSRRVDPLAKGMAQQILEFPIPVTEAIAREVTLSARAAD